MASEKAPRGSLLLRFALLSLLCFAMLGVVLGQVLESRIRSRAAEQAMQVAALLTAEISEGRLTRRSVREGLAAHEEAEIDALIKNRQVQADIATVKVWNREGRVVYSGDKDLEGRTFAQSLNLRESFGGRTVIEFELEDSDEVEQSRDLFEVYVPLRFGPRGRPTGVLETYFKRAPVRAEVTGETRTLYAVLGAGLLGLYLVLFPLLARASRRLRKSYRYMRSVADEFQHAVLPAKLPTPAGAELAARYLPSGGSAHVGGDWYDAVPYTDGRLAMVIGDVVGRGIEAARLMSQLKSALRMQALDTDSPATLLERANTYLRLIAPETIVTAAVALWDDVRAQVTVASAGHLPPVLIGPEGGARLIDARVGVPLGAQSVVVYKNVTVELAAPSTLILYTDGLVEDRLHGLGEQLERLRAAAQAGPSDLEALCDHLAASAPARGGGVVDEDDVAILALRVRSIPGERLAFEIPAEADALAAARGRLGRWLDVLGAEPAEAHRLLMACGEACTNAIEHAYGLGEARVLIDAAWEGGEVEVTIRDFGRWRSSAPESTRGRGLPIMEQLTDELRVDRGNDGTTVSLRRRVRNRAPAAAAGSGPRVA